jgi:flagellar biosynthesis protein FlhG
VADAAVHLDPEGRRSRRVHAIAVASGKGGVGKTNVVANLAVALRRRGRRVVVLDADLGLGNVDALLGLTPRATLGDVLRGTCSLHEALAEGPGGVRVVPAANGAEELTRLTDAQRLLLLDQVDALDGECDVLLLDTGPGISSNVLFFASAAHETIVVVTPEPTALADAYALIKVLATRYAEHDFGVLVNMARSEWEAKTAFGHLAGACERCLHVGVRWAGWVPLDPALPDAVRARRPVVDAAPTSAVSRAFETLADTIDGSAAATRPKGGLQFFFRRLLTEVPA